MKSYSVLLHNFNSKKEERYDIMPYLIDTYKKCLKDKWWWPLDDPKKGPVTREDFNLFVSSSCKSQYWSRCEYEWLMISWPPGKMDTLEQCQNIINSSRKIDAWDQIEMNLEIVTDIFMENIKSL